MLLALQVLAFFVLSYANEEQRRIHNLTTRYNVSTTDWVEATNNVGEAKNESDRLVVSLINTGKLLHFLVMNTGYDKFQLKKDPDVKYKYATNRTFASVVEHLRLHSRQVFGEMFADAQRIFLEACDLIYVTLELYLQFASLYKDKTDKRLVDLSQSLSDSKTQMALSYEQMNTQMKQFQDHLNEVRSIVSTNQKELGKEKIDPTTINSTTKGNSIERQKKREQLQSTYEEIVETENLMWNLTLDRIQHKIKNKWILINGTAGEKLKSRRFPRISVQKSVNYSAEWASDSKQLSTLADNLHKSFKNFTQLKSEISATVALLARRNISPVYVTNVVLNSWNESRQEFQELGHLINFKLSECLSQIQNNSVWGSALTKSAFACTAYSIGPISLFSYKILTYASVASQYGLPDELQQWIHYP